MVQAGQQQASPWAGRGWLFIVLFGVAYAIVSRVALDGFTFSGDEYSMFLQGEIFARGLLHAATPAHAELLRVDHAARTELTQLDEQEPEVIERHRDEEVRKAAS